MEPKMKKSEIKLVLVGTTENKFFVALVALSFSALRITCIGNPLHISHVVNACCSTCFTLQYNRARGATRWRHTSSGRKGLVIPFLNALLRLGIPLDFSQYLAKTNGYQQTTRTGKVTLEAQITH